MMSKSSSTTRPRGWKAWTCGLAIVGASFGGATAALASPTVPGAPAITSVSIGDRTVRLGFSKPASDGGSPIFSYKATCVSSDGGATRTRSEHHSTIRVEGLTAGKTYTCNVMARNKVGFGPPSASTSPFVALPVLPGAPTITSVTIGNHSVRLGFSKPASNGGSSIFSYKAICTSSDGGTTRSRNEHHSTIRVEGLTAGKTYTCTVAARNRIGFGPASAPTAPFLALPMLPGAPNIISATPGVENISVAFSPPANNGGANISEYKATCVSSDGGVSRWDTRHTSPILVNRLTALKTYTCTVMARNRMGFGPPSGPSTPVVTLGKTVVTAPGAPSIISVTPGVKNISVAFSPPASDGGANISDYKATCVSSDGGVSKWDDRHTSPILVSNLTGHKTYTCTVMARNKIGFGPPSASSGQVVTLS